MYSFQSGPQATISKSGEASVIGDGLAVAPVHKLQISKFPRDSRRKLKKQIIQFKRYAILANRS